jgi:hypothetical protein
MGYTLNHRYFDVIDSEAKAYFSGLLFADGCVGRSGKNSWRTSIGLLLKDQHIVERLRQELNYSGKLYLTKNRCSLRISSRYLGDSLIKLGCVPKKSLILRYPQIPLYLTWHFIRGYFDGDGCLSVSGRGARWSLVGTKHFLGGVKMFLKSKSIHATLVQPGKYWMLSVSGNRQIKKLLDQLYEGATVYLNRKWEKSCEFESLLADIRPIKRHSVPLDKSSIVKAYVDGMPILEIEKRFDVTNAMVYRYLKKHKVALRQNKRGVPSPRRSQNTNP